MPNNYCQNFKQKIKELEIKAQNIEALLLEYKEKGDKQIAEEIDSLLKEIEEFKQEFKTQATQLIEEFVQRRDNADEKVEIIFDEKDGRFIIDGDLDFYSLTHLDAFPNLIKKIIGYISAPPTQTINLPNLKEVGGYFDAEKAETINLPNLEKIGEHFDIYNAETINLPNLKKIGGDFYAHNAQTINLPNLKEVGGYFGAENAQTINLPNLEKIEGDFNAKNVQTINLPNIKEIGGDIYFNENNPNLNSLIKIAREWRKKGILKGKIKIFNEEGNLVQEF